MKQKNKTAELSKRVAIYCRVSTYEQGKGDFSSLKSQETLIRQYCESKSWAIHEVYSDTKSGTSLERDELTRLLRDAQSGHFDIVAITKLDRISRSVKDFLELDETLRQLGIDIAVTTQNIDTTTPAGKMQRTIMLAFAEFERDMIAERTREKLYTQAQKGIWGGGIVPLGYDINEKKLAINREEADLVRKIFSLYLKVPSTSKVAQILNSEGYKTKIRYSKRKQGERSGGNAFNKQSVRDILRNHVYLGIVSFKGEMFPGIHTPIVDADTFQKVQERLDLSTIDHKVTQETSSPLTLLGITRCGHCGSLLSTSSTYKQKLGKRFYYYKCSKASHHTKEHCSARDLPASQLEELLFDIMIKAIRNKHFLGAIAKQMGGNNDLEKAALDTEIKSLEANSTSMTRQIDNLLHHMSESAALSDSDALSKKLRNLEAQQSTLRDTIEEKRQMRRRMEDGGSVNLEVLSGLMEDFEVLYQGFDKESKRRVNHLVFSSVTSHLRRGETTGEIEIQLRGNGILCRTWNDLKNLKVAKSTKSSNGMSGSISDVRPGSVLGGGSTNDGDGLSQTGNARKTAGIPSGSMEADGEGDGSDHYKKENQMATSGKHGVRAFGFYGSTGRARTCNPPVNSRMLYH